MVGYQAGYGEVADVWPQGTGNRYIRIRTVLLVAVKNDLALVAGAIGPYHAFGPDFGPGLRADQRSGANLNIREPGSREDRPARPLPWFRCSAARTDWSR